MTQLDREGGRLARVIASDLVEYFRAPSSPFAGSELRVRELASQGLWLLRSRFGHDEGLERYYADCLGSAFGSLALDPPALATLRSSSPLDRQHPPEEQVTLVFGRRKA